MSCVSWNVSLLIRQDSRKAEVTQFDMPLWIEQEILEGAVKLNSSSARIVLHTNIWLNIPVNETVFVARFYSENHLVITESVLSTIIHAVRIKPTHLRDVKSSEVFLKHVLFDQ